MPLSCLVEFRIDAIVAHLYCERIQSFKHDFQQCAYDGLYAGDKGSIDLQSATISNQMRTERAAGSPAARRHARKRLSASVQISPTL